MGVVIRQSILTSVISYVGVAIGYVNLLYLYPKFLQLEQIGLLRTIQDFAMLLVPFATFGLAQSILRFFPFFSFDKKNPGAFLTLILTLGLISYGIFLSLFLLFQDNIMALYSEKAGELVSYTNLILWLTFLLLTLTLLEQYSRSLMKVAIPSFLREVGIRLLQAFLVVIFFFQWVSFHQLIVASVFIYVLAIVILLAYLFAQGLKLNFNYQAIPRKKIKEIIVFSSLSFIGSSAIIFIGKMDSLMVTGMLGLASNAVYTTAFYMATVIEIPKRAITITASPLIAKAFEQNDLQSVNSIYKKTSINQFIIGALLLTGVSANLYTTFELMPNGELYKPGTWVVIIVGFGKLLDMLFGPSSEIIGLSKYYWFNIVMVTLLAAMIIVLNYLLIPRLGITGAAYGSAIALILFNVAKFIFIYAQFKIQPFTKATVKVLVISVFIAFIGLILPRLENIMIDLLYRSAVITILFSFLIIQSKSSEEVTNLFSKITGYRILKK